MAIQNDAQDARDEIFSRYLSTKSPALDVTGTVNPDIFDMENKIIRVPESVYKYHRKRSSRMPKKYIPTEFQRKPGTSRALPFFPEEGEMLGDWNIELMFEKEGEKKYEFVDESETEYLNRMGIDTSGAPMGIVRTATWLPNDSFALGEGGGVEKVLRDYYPDATEPDGSPFDFAVRQEPVSRRYMYRDPEKEGQYQTLFAPGLQLTDIAAEFPELVGEVAAGLGASVLASPSGPGMMLAAGVSAEAVAATLMRTNQLFNMREKGYLSPKYNNDMDLFIEAVKHGGMVGAFGLGGSAAFTLFRRVINSAGLRNYSPAIEWDEDVFIKAYDQVMAESDEIVETLTAPQILLHSSVEGADTQPASEYWQELSQMGSKAGKEYDQVRETIAQQDAIKEKTLRDQFAEGTDETLEDVLEIGPAEMSRRGSVIQEGIETQRRPEVERLESDIIDFQQEAFDAADDFLSGATPMGQSGVAVRNSIETVRDKVNDVLDAKYASIEKDIQGNPVFDTTPLIKFANQNSKKIERDILPSLAVEDRVIIEDLLGLGLKAEKSAGRKVNYEQLKRAITNVNGQISKAQQSAQSGASTPQLGFLKQLKSQLKGMREQLVDPDTSWGKNIIERNPNILDDLAQIEKRYANFNDNFTRDIAGKIIRKLKGSGSRYEVGDEGVVKQAIMNDNPTGRRTLRAILNTPEGLEGLEAIRSGIKGLYRKKMQTATGDTKLLTEAQHDSFMDQYGDAMKEWLDPKDFKRFENAASASKYAQEQVKGLEKSRKALTQFAWGSEELLDQPEKLFDTTFKSNEITYSKNLKTAIDKLESSMKDDFIDMYKGMIYKDFVKTTSEITKKAGDKVSLDLDPRKVVKYLDEHGDQMAVWYGDDFAKGLNGWGDHLRALLPKGKSAVSIADNAKLKAGLDIVRAYVGIFTRPGRMITAALRLGKSGKEKAVIDGLLNPKKLRTVNARDRFLSNPYTQTVVRELASFKPEQDYTGAQLDPQRSQGYSPDQTGTEVELELFGPDEFSTKSPAREYSPTPFNKGGPVKLMRMKHGY